MKKLLLLLFIFSAGISSAQTKVKLNGKPLAEGAVVKAEDIKSLEVAFDNPKKISYVGLGRVMLGFVLMDENKKYTLEEYLIKKEGTNAVEAFLGEKNVYFKVIPDAGGEVDFSPIQSSGNLLNRLTRLEDKTIKVEINFIFQDKVGYNKFGDAIPLTKKVAFTIDNSVNAANYAKAQEEKNAKAAAEKAEREKADAAAAKEAEAKKKKKSVLGGLLNKI